MQAKNSKNLSNFKAAWQAIPHSQKPKVRKLIKEKAFIDSDYKFNDRKNGRVIPCEVEAIVICEVFATYGIDALTGLQLQPKKTAS